MQAWLGEPQGRGTPIPRWHFSSASGAALGANSNILGTCQWSGKYKRSSCQRCKEKGVPHKSKEALNKPPFPETICPSSTTTRQLPSPPNRAFPAIYLSPTLPRNRLLLPSPTDKGPHIPTKLRDPRKQGGPGRGVERAPFWPYDELTQLSQLFSGH